MRCGTGQAICQTKTRWEAEQLLAAFEAKHPDHGLHAEAVQFLRLDTEDLEESLGVTIRREID